MNRAIASILSSVGEESPATSSGQIKIDKGVPIPPRLRPGPPPSKYPWRQLAIGDSFVYPPAATLRQTLTRAASACAYRKSDHGETYTIRTVEENGQRVVRVWRVA